MDPSGGDSHSLGTPSFDGVGGLARRQNKNAELITGKEFDPKSARSQDMKCKIG